MTKFPCADRIVMEELMAYERITYTRIGIKKKCFC